MPNTDMIDKRMFPITENLIGIARDEFKFYTLDIQNRQTKIQNIYFWIASMLFTLYTTSFKGLFIGQTFIHLGVFPSCPLWLHQELVGIAFITSIWVVFTGVYEMQSHTGHVDICGSSSCLAMFEEYTVRKDISQIDIVRHFLKQCEINTAHNRNACIRRGKHLHRTAYIIIISMFFGIIGFII